MPGESSRSLWPPAPETYYLADKSLAEIMQRDFAKGREKITREGRPFSPPKCLFSRRIARL
ncbi:MAG: hypothetical protein DU429_05550 [Candidatus Tokpelaia sp.]|nr:MAG: hypothetical protein DU430_04775 [Candidatus Tokpelaia sp.]KAA6206798.1 MAG: hypothetical protein DU429_05550 [Candidatus Tokpelaia sp.]KAA6406215.1 hypothetical protein DPQ22_00720 [Candidatus Tokpelaia sp.]